MSFFDKLGEKASEVYNTTAEKTNRLTREMKLKSTINDNKGKINKIYQEIGEKIYTNHKNKENLVSENEFSEILYQIDLYQKEIEECQNEIRSLKELKLCEKCMKEMNKSAKFCPFCGGEQKDNVSVTNSTEENKNCAFEKSIKNIDNNEAIETAISNDNSMRKPEIVKDNTILDIPEPEVIVEEIGTKEDSNDVK